MDRNKLSLQISFIAVAVTTVLSNPTIAGEAKALNKDELAYGVTNPVERCRSQDGYSSPGRGRMDEFSDPMSDPFEHMDRIFDSMGGQRVEDPCYW